MLTSKCTFYKNVVEHQYKGGPLVTPGRIAPIIDILTNERYTNGNLLNEVRLSGYKSEQYNTLKKQLSAACLSSVQDDMSVDRSDANHLFHTGYIAFDIDPGDNPYLLTDGESIRDFIIDNIPYIAYLGKSVSNLGYWGLIPILNKDDHYGHYEAMKQLFLGHKIIIDKTSDISRLRFIAYDPDGYINDDAKLFTESIILTENFIQDEYERPASNELFLAACRWVEAKYDIQFKKGYIHNYLLYFYATMRACKVARPAILNWVYNNLIEESQVTTNCLDEPKWKDK
jgi:hypothetical protein